MYNFLITVDGVLSGVSETSVVVANIPDNTPDSGSLRVVLNSGKTKHLFYSGYSGNEFTIISADFSSDNAGNGNDIWVAYLDTVPGDVSESFTYTYGSDSKVVVSVRDPIGLIEPFITSATLGNITQTINTIRSSDA